MRMRFRRGKCMDFGRIRVKLRGEGFFFFERERK